MHNNEIDMTQFNFSVLGTSDYLGLIVHRGFSNRVYRLFLYTRLDDLDQLAGVLGCIGLCGFHL